LQLQGLCFFKKFVGVFLSKNFSIVLKTEKSIKSTISGKNFNFLVGFCVEW
jgi:hypothetical protein